MATKTRTSNDHINHDEDVAKIINRIISAPVVFSVINTDDGAVKTQKVYELKVDITIDEINNICAKMKKVFLDAETLIQIDMDSPITVVADLHGQVIHLLRILRTCGAPPAQRYLFLGDYVDRGVQGVLILCLLFCLKHRYPNHIYLLRGNHEDVNTTLNYGFYDECVLRFPSMDTDNVVHGEKIWRNYIEVFNTMPLAALIGSKIFCCHGGISPFMTSLSDIQKIERPLIVPPYGLACDLLWSDPSNGGRDGWSLSHRGISFTYGFDIAEEFCKTNNISMIIRGHQLFRELYSTGYIVRFGGLLISLFSALNYENHRNNAAVMKIVKNKDNKFEITPITFRCRHYAPQNQKETIAYRDHLSKTNDARRKLRKSSSSSSASCSGRAKKGSIGKVNEE